MKNYFPSFLLILMLLAGCAKTNELATPSENGDNTNDEVVQLLPRNLDKAVFHEGAQNWMIPQNDPYTLANFQATYDRLASGSSEQYLTRTETAEFTPSQKLIPTHYALRVFPKNEEEEWKIEMMEDVKVRYIPFDYVQLTEDEIERLPIAKTRSMEGNSPEVSDTAKFSESYRYSVTYTDLTTVEGHVPDQTFILPILYVVWPVDKPFPEDMEYEIDYPVFLPPYDTPSTRVAAGLSFDSLQTLEAEAISQALGILVPKQKMETRASAALGGYMQTRDNYLNTYVPMPRLRIKYELGSFIVETRTDEFGFYSIAIPYIPMGIQHVFYVLFQDPQGKWKITKENATTPFNGGYAINAGAPKPGMNNQDIHMIAGERQANEIHRAVSYLYGNHNPYFSLPSIPDGIRIIADSHSHPSWNGSFTSYASNSSGNPWITIYNNGNTNARVMGTVLHELGHFAHWSAYKSSFSGIHGLLKESYASYAGWYLGEAYYASQGWTKTSQSQDITGQARQGWKKTGSNHYSPLFVDLVDNYNQGTGRPAYPNDEARNVSPGRIFTIINHASSWTEFKQLIRQYNGSTQLEAYLADYDYWFANN